MKHSNAFITTRKSVGSEVEAISHELALRAGLINQLGSGLYSFLPLGQRILRKIEQVVRDEIEDIGALEVSLPIVQPVELWRESGRLDTYGAEMLRFKNRDGKEFCFGPTHEEVISQVARDYIESYKQLPFILYQVGRKFRDEKRPRYGLLRCKEFLMKDAYSFDKDVPSMQGTYQRFRQAYINIFDRLNLNYVIASADPGEIGGSGSEEFLAYSHNGEDKFYLDKEGRALKLESLTSVAPEGEAFTGLEIGHIFQLGQAYSKKMGVSFVSSNGEREHVYMGCYGIGVSRILASIIDQHHDKDGIIWPKSIAPYEVIILPLQQQPAVMETAAQLQQQLKQVGISTIMDDRDCNAGVKFKDANLIGIPLKIVISEKNLKQNQVELENRRTNEKIMGELSGALGLTQKILQNDII